MAVDSECVQNHMLSSDLSKHLPSTACSPKDASQQARSVEIMGRSPSILSNAKIRSSAGELSFRVPSSRSFSEEINGIGSNVAGILFKWVNYGKGWRPRWFVLQDGVLSYYKVHGPNKITVNLEQRGFHVVGDASIRYLKTHRDINTCSQLQGALGELHLKVSSIWKSQTDDKKFYVFTGTKTLSLRTFTREDRRIWLDSLQAAKNLFLKIPVDRPVMLSLEDKTVSTKALKSHLIEEGMSDAAIARCEEIMISEFHELQNQLTLLQRNYIAVVKKLKLMEAEKMQLETSVVGERLDEQDLARSSGDGRDGAKDLDDDIEKHNADSDDDDAYFDTNECFSFHQNTITDSISNFFDLHDASPRPTSNLDSSMNLSDFNYPYVERRKKLPEPKEQEKGVSLWSLIKENIGKDLTKVCLPVYFNEPISSLQKCFEDLEYSYLLDRAYVWGKQGNSLMRLLNVAAFAVSGYASTENRHCKPFNPLLGETYEADFPDKGLRFFSEKVSHHPMIVACHCDGQGWKFWGDSTVKSKFWGRSIQLEPLGILTLEFDDGETFQWSKVTTSIYNLILGKIYCDHYGTMRIQGNRGISCRLKFKEQSIMDRNHHQVQGFVYDENGQKLASLFGKWDESMYYVNGDLSAMPKGYDPMSEAVLLWERSKPSKFPTRYNLTSFAITLNEITPGLMMKLPPTDSRLRPDQRYLENGEYERAYEEKLRLEEKQRMAHKLQESGWQPRWFRKDKGADTYKYIGGYWEARCNRQWDSCPNIFGPELTELPQK